MINVILHIIIVFYLKDNSPSFLKLQKINILKRGCNEVNFLKSYFAVASFYFKIAFFIKHFLLS